MQIICTLSFCPHLALPPLLGNSYFFHFTSLHLKQWGPTPVLSHPLYPSPPYIHSLCLPCHRNWPCIRLHWPAITSPSHAFDLSAVLGLRTTHVLLANPILLSVPLLPAWRGSGRALFALHPSDSVLPRGLKDSLAAAYPAQISLSNLQLQFLLRTLTNTIWLQLYGTLQLSGATIALWVTRFEEALF